MQFGFKEYSEYQYIGSSQQNTEYMQNRPHTASANRFMAKPMGFHPDYQPQTQRTPKQAKTKRTQSHTHSPNSKYSKGTPKTNPSPSSPPPAASPDLQLLNLINNEHSILSNLRLQLAKQKSQIESDFNDYSKHLSNLLEDSKTSLIACLDVIYAECLHKFASIVTELRVVNQSYEDLVQQNQKEIVRFRGRSNRKLVEDLANREAIEDKQHKMEEAKEIRRRVMDRVQAVYADLKNMLLQAREFYFKANARDRMGQLSTLVKQYTDQINIQAAARAHSGLKHGDGVGTFKPTQQNPQVQTSQFQQYAQNYQPQNPQYPNYPETSSQQSHHQPTNSAFFPADSNLQKFSKPANTVAKDNFSAQLFCRNLNNIPPLFDKCTGQTLAVGSFSNISIQFMKSIKTHQQQTLCAVMVNECLIACGGKDCTIEIVAPVTGHLTTLKGHRASVCTLCTFTDRQGTTYLASGGDNGCNSILMWDTRNWSLTNKYTHHQSAVTSIVNFGDGSTFFSGSYDKKIASVCFKTGNVLKWVRQESAVTRIVLTCSRTRLVTSGLDEKVFVWLVKPNGDLLQERVIQCKNIVTSLCGSLLRSDVVVLGIRDGNIEFRNIANGEVERNTNFGGTGVIELAVIERHSRPQSPATVFCGAKDTQLTVLLGEHHTPQSRQTLSVVNGLNIEYGLGIGPKIFFSRFEGELIMGLVSQSTRRKQISLYWLKLT